LIIDEVGFDRIERSDCAQAHLLYKIIASCHQKRSTALVTNMDFDKWGELRSAQEEARITCVPISGRKRRCSFR
jgi:DNA replication protein DnaC